MIYAFTESGESDGHFLEELYGKRNNLGPYGRALLALALQERKDGRAKEIAGLIEGAAQRMNSKRTGRPRGSTITAAMFIWMPRRRRFR